MKYAVMIIALLFVTGCTLGENRLSESVESKICSIPPEAKARLIEIINRDCGMLEE